MSNASDLLRMLEPAVRPLAVPGRGAQSAGPQSTPFEKLSFEQMLNEAGGMQSDQNDLIDNGADGQMNDLTDTNKTQQKQTPLNMLSQLDRIENASLRQLFEQMNSQRN